MAEAMDTGGIVRGIFDALRRGDLVALQGTSALNLVVHIDGESPYAGTYEGVGAVMALVADITRELVPTSVRVEDVSSDGPEYADVTTAMEFKRLTGETLEARIHQRFRFDSDGRVVEAWARAEDQETVDRFLRGSSWPQ